jgi:ArsR family transcriptional regulator
MNICSYIEVFGQGIDMEVQDYVRIDQETVMRVAELFRALGDISRVKILIALLQKEMNVGALAEEVGISESAVSHHLRNLRQLHLVRARKHGRQVFYCLDDDHINELIRSGVDHVLHG